MTAFSLLSSASLLPLWVLAAWCVPMVLLPLAVLGVMIMRRAGKVRRAEDYGTVASVPEELARQAQPWLGRLGYLGHAVAQTLRPAGEEERVLWVMPQAKERSVAVLVGTLPRGGGRPVFALKLMSFLADGRVIVTADHPVTHRPPAHWSLCQMSFPLLDGQVQAHRDHVEAQARGVPVVLPPAAELAARLSAEEASVNEALVASGDYHAAGERAIRPSLGRLPALAARDFAARISGLREAAPKKKDIASAGRSTVPGEEEGAPASGPLAASLEELVAQDIRRYRQHSDQPAGLKHVGMRLALLVATVFAFTAIFGRENPVPTVGMLLGLIALHEFGHWVMMRLFGYQRMGWMFVPFVGPVDRGRKLHAPAWQQLVVILAGPLPGLVGGMVVLVTGFFRTDVPLWLQDLGGLALVLNAFHLLPFLPLDGGKVVDLLIFRDLPILRPIFTGFSALATLAASFLVKSKVIRVIAAGMFAGMVWDIRMIKVVRGGRRLGWTVDDETEALQRIFRGVREEQNEGFLRSHDWKQQIDVLLAEVLRKKPGIATRILGGGFYWSACMLPVLLVAGMFAMMFVGTVGQLNRLAKELPEFLEAFPVEQRSLTEAQHVAISEVIESTREYSTGEGERTERAARAEPALGKALDQLDWTVAGITHRCDELQTPEISVWLEILCGKLEAATRDGRQPEAVRRAEVLLHAAAQMEPALTLADRELLWDAQLRTLAAVEKLSATGGLDAATRQRLETRITVLNKAPLPEVENLLLVAGWGKIKGEAYLAIQEGKAAEKIDVRFWRQANPQMWRFSENIKSFQDSLPACVALARHWKKTRRVGELPPTLEETPQVGPGEAEFIAAFCDRHCEVAWRRMATLSALKMETYRSKNGNFPPHWKYTLPGGGRLELVNDGTPHLVLADARGKIRDRLPAWLGPCESATLAEHHAPLFGARR